MKSRLIQNSESTSMLKACGAAASKDHVKFISIATAFITPSGLLPIHRFIEAYGVKEVRILIGARPSRKLSDWVPPSDNHIQEQVQRQRSDFVRQCSLTPFEKEPREALQELERKSEAGKLQMRIHTENFMHAKTYIFSDEAGEKGEVIMGSSNLTNSGLKNNIEMNIGNEEKPLFEETLRWFNDLWGRSEEFDFAQMARKVTELKKPYDIFLRVLLAEYQDDLGSDVSNARLTSFQKHGVDRALRILKQRRGAIIADEVGLGKTFIAGEIINEFHKNGQQALIICPASLRDAVWKEHLIDMRLPSTEILSYEQFGRNEFLQKQGIDKYQLIVIDEAHNYRNLKAPYRGRALTQFLRGRRRDVLMLTATPVNNSLWDLYGLMMYFLKQDTAFSNKRILSVKDRFRDAMETEDHSRIPNLLFDIIDATTMKRTRKFIKRYYSNEFIKTKSGEQKIHFPTPIPSTINYDLDEEMPAVYGLVEKYLGVGNSACLSMAIYKTDCYLLKHKDQDTCRRLDAMTGLVMSGLLKRFESSEAAFRKSLQRKIAQHEEFLKRLRQGRVIGKEYFDSSLEFSNEDDDYVFEDKELDASRYPSSDQYNSAELKKNVSRDLDKLKEIYNKLEGLTPSDAKYRRVVEELELIAEKAKKGKDARSRRDCRKVIIFSFYADTAKKIYAALGDTIKNNSKLSSYLEENGDPRLALITGEHKRSRFQMAKNFAPRKNGGDDTDDKVDILVSTDVMAEGVNLQQAGNLINYDLPWNPMRLVQRHGRLDRIDSEHGEISLRSVFPDKRLNGLLKLNEKIQQKISWAASSVGVVSPVKHGPSRDRVFAGTKEEIIRLSKGDASIYENAGMRNSPQSGEEYRQILRDELKANNDRISELPLRSGSIMRKGNNQGMYYLAEIKNKNFHCFIRTKRNWKPTMRSDTAGKQDAYDVNVDLGNCLSIIQCSPEQKTVDDRKIIGKAYDLWPVAQEIFQSEWDWHTKPENLQPRIEKINHRIYEFLLSKQANSNLGSQAFSRAYKILNSQWPKAYQDDMREIYRDGKDNSVEICNQLVEYINSCGLEPAEDPKIYDAIVKEDIQLIVWMAVLPEKK